MIRRIVTIVILIPIAVILIALAVANRHSVPLRLDIFNPQNPALTINAPFYLWLLAAVAFGILAGGIASWFSQGKHRRQERKYKREADKLRYEVEDRRRRSGEDVSGEQSLVLSR